MSSSSLASVPDAPSALHSKPTSFFLCFLLYFLFGPRVEEVTVSQGLCGRKGAWGVSLWALASPLLGALCSGCLSLFSGPIPPDGVCPSQQTGGLSVTPFCTGDPCPSRLEMGVRFYTDPGNRLMLLNIKKYIKSCKQTGQRC